MSTVENLVDDVRSMLQGSLADELNVLGEDYVAGSGHLVLKYPKRAIGPGTVLSMGLNTFYVLSAGSDSTAFDVLASYDGGPDVSMTGPAIVRVKPQHTNWAAFREIATDIASMTSPSVGLYSPRILEGPIQYSTGMYPLPDDFPAVQKVVRARVRRGGTADWVALTNVEYIPEAQSIRILGWPCGTNVEFVVAVKYVVPTGLDDDLLTVCGIPEEAQDIPTYGACAALGLSREGRRQQPFSQGDARRSEEVQAGANLGVGREWGRMRKQRVDDELSRLTQLYGYQQQGVGAAC